MSEPPIKIRKLSNGRSVLIDADSRKPRLVKLWTREATSAPARLKAMLSIPLIDTSTDADAVLPMPFAAAHVGSGFTAEFRLEMN